MRMKKATAFGLAALMAATMIPAVPAMAKGDDSEGSVYYLNSIIYTSHYMEEVEQICTRIAIMDHGRVIAQGTKEELKQMIKTGETITVEAIALEEKNLRDIRTLEHVFDVQYEKQVLVVRCTDAKHNLIRLLNYLQSQDISFGRVFSELPTLNDVFLEITGKQLRD